MNDPAEPEHPRSFRLSRGPSDLGSLFFALAFGLVLIIAPLAARWLYRAIILLFALFLLRYILALHRLGPPVPPRTTRKDPIGNAIVVGVILVWIWVIARMFAAGNWIDAMLTTLVVPPALYLRWLRIHHTPTPLD